MLSCTLQQHPAVFGHDEKCYALRRVMIIRNMSNNSGIQTRPDSYAPRRSRACAVSGEEGTPINHLDHDHERLKRGVPAEWPVLLVPEYGPTTSFMTGYNDILHILNHVSISAVKRGVEEYCLAEVLKGFWQLVLLEVDAC